MKRFVRDLREKEQVQSVFLAVEKTLGKDRNGKSFLSVMLSDSTGQLNARLFEKVDESAGAFEPGDAVWVKGFVQVFQNRKQILIHEVRKATAEEFAMNDLVPDLGGDPKVHLQALLKIVSEIKNEFIRQLLLTTLNDSETQTLLLKAPAAKSIHHAYRGGLIEHIHSIVKLMNVIAEFYPFLDHDLLVFGAIYHDIGKLYELDLSSGIHYTDSGRLVGHMAQACEMIDVRAAAIPWFPKELKDVLKHIVLSHHGKLEYGSPKLPMLAEAMVVAMIDDFDSKMNTLFHFLKNEAEVLPASEKWTHFHSGFERYFFLDFFRKKIEP